MYGAAEDHPLQFIAKLPEIVGVTADPDYQISVQIGIVIGFLQSFCIRAGDLHLHAAQLHVAENQCF